jgi:hypothetical protein
LPVALRYGAKAGADASLNPHAARADGRRGRKIYGRSTRVPQQLVGRSPASSPPRSVDALYPRMISSPWQSKEFTMPIICKNKQR